MALWPGDSLRFLLSSALRVHWGREKPMNHADLWGEKDKKEGVGEGGKEGESGREREGAGERQRHRERERRQEGMRTPGPWCQPALYS